MGLVESTASAHSAGFINDCQVLGVPCACGHGFPLEELDEPLVDVEGLLDEDAGALLLDPDDLLLDDDD